MNEKFMEKQLDEAHRLTQNADDHYRRGELPKGITNEGAAISILEEMKVQCPVQWGFAEETDLAFVYARRGEAFFLEGEIDLAMGDYDAAISRLEDASNSDDEQIALAILYTRRGDARFWQDELSQALDDYTATIALLKRVRTTRSDHRRFKTRANLALAYTRRANIRGRQGRLFQAIEDYDAGIAVLKDLQPSHPGQWGFVEQFGLAIACSERGEVHFRMEAVGQAVKDHETAVHILRNLKATHLVDWGPLEQMELALACIRSSEAHQHMGNVKQACSDWDSADSIYEEIESNSDCLVSPVMKESLFDVHARMFELLLRLDHRSIHRWAWTKSQRMARELELALPSDEHRHSSELRRPFSAFHSKWLKYSAEHDLERIPVILSAIQGRKLAAQIQEELDQDPTPPPEVEAYRDLRHRLIDLRRDLIEESERITRGRRICGGKTDPELPGDRRLHTNPVTGVGGSGIQDLMVAYKTDLAKVSDLRRDAARHEGYATLMHPFEPVTVEDLQEKLAGDEALVLLIDRAVDGPHGQGAYVVRQGHAPKWIQLDDMSQCMVKGQDDASVPSTHEAEFWQACNGLRERLWTPLQHDLQGVKKAVVVTHGRLHLLPLEAGRPDDLELIFYPGLIYFNQRRPTKWPAGRLRLGLCSYPGDEDQTQIPLTGAECRMIADLHRQVRDTPDIEYPLDFDVPRSIELLFLSCHGRSDFTHPGRNSLAIGRGKSLDARRIHAGGVHAYYVFASACLGGVTIEDDDGDPLGLFAGFWLRGARVMIAALVPVPDEWMPLLSLLTIQAMLRGPHVLEVALREGKRRLASGEWYEDSAEDARDGTEALMRKHVLPELKRCLRPKLEAYRKGPRIKLAERIKRLCEAYAVDLDVSGELSNRFAINAGKPGRSEEVMDEIVDACVEARLARRVPPCPGLLATLLFGVCAFGETERSRN